MRWGRGWIGGLLRGAVLLGVGVGALSARAAGVRAAAEAGQDRALEARLDALVQHHAGHVALFAMQLNTGRTVAIDADQPVQTASVIKLTLLYEAMEQVRAGRLRWTDPETMNGADQVKGSGVLQFFSTPLRLTMKDVLTMMVIVSDNTATNLAIDRLGLDATNERTRSLGLGETYLYKKIGKPASGPMPADQPKFGLGKTTAREMASLMERIGRCELEEAGPGSPTVAVPTEKDRAICQTALTMLQNQFYRDTVPRYLDQVDTSETGSAIASKTGSLDAVRNDVAIVAATSGPIVLSIFTYGNQDQSWTVDNAAEVLIAKLAREVVTAWSPGGTSSAGLVPGLGLPESVPERILPLRGAPASKE